MNSSKIVVLRCVKCGAPLPEPKTGVDYVTCEYCGYTQRIIDSREYVEKLRGEIYQWIREMVPPSTIISATVDPVARHNIFAFNIKPKITAEFTLSKARLSTFMSHPLIYLPFWTPPDVRLDEEPKSAYERQAKIESLNPLIAVEEDASFFNEVKTTIETYASTLNALYLLREKVDTTFLVKNFEAASSSLENASGKETEHKRLLATYKAYVAIQKLMDGDAKAASIYLEEANREFNKAIVDAKKNPMLAPMVPSITKDLYTIECLSNLTQASLKYLEVGKAATEFLAYMEKYFKLAEEVRVGRKEMGGKADISRYKELSAHIRDIVFTKAGSGGLEALPGRGEVLFPLWDVYLTYTFTTGALFMKKGKEVEERLLIAATIPKASQPVTDVFGIGPSVGLLDKFKGKETTLSGGTLFGVVNQVRKTSVPSSQRIIPPLSTKEEAEEASKKYLNATSAHLRGKIKFGVSKVERLLFAPAEIKGNDIYIPPLENLQISTHPYLPNLLEVAL